MGWLIGLPLGIFRLLGGLLMAALRLAPPILLVAGLIWFLRKRRGEKAAAEKPAFDGPVYTVDYEDVKDPPLDGTPDAPAPFGYKTCWLAVKCDDPARVMKALDFRERTPANWETGLAAAYEGHGVFVSPCLDGFVLAVGGEEWPSAFLEGLGGGFSQAQFFATHRVTEYHRWGKYADGHLVRDYCYCGESGQVLRDQGDWTAEEIALGFGRFPRTGREDGCEDVPTEEDVLDIAAAWGVDPRFEKTAYPPSAGWLCT